ncbi:MAG: hypothetical protein IKE38_00335 [Erysipelotrichaceae bacterium]|nr:hypothetical protein [Erysipelotrichaceae bacterium]
MTRAYIKDEQGREYIHAEQFEGFRYEVKRNDSRYNGYGFPFDFKINCWSEDETALLSYFCPLRYIDDDYYLPDPDNEFKRDDYGRIIRTFKTADEFIDNWMSDFKKQYVPTLVKKVYPTIDGQDQKERQQQEYDELVKNKKRGETIDSHYHWAVIYTYAYEKQGTKRNKVVECEIKGTKKTLYMECDMRLYDPFSMDLFKMAYPKTVKGSDGSLWAPYNTYRIWEVTHMIILDCMANEYEKYYPAYFNELFTWESNWSPSLRKECETLQGQVSEKYRLKREQKAAEKAEQRKIDEINRKAREEKLARDKAFYDSIRKTTQETHDIINSSYENSRKAHDNAFEMWSDAFNDNTRFVDKHGNEHVIRTFDDYAYKSGDTYVTSDIDHGDLLDWERLEKKKY